MDTNVGPKDAAARFVIAAALILFAVAFTDNLIVELVAYFMAAIAITTGLMGYCPLYALLSLGSRTGSELK